MTNFNELRAKFASEKAMWAKKGIIAQDSAVSYMPTEFKNDFNLALDAQPQLITSPNSGIPSFLLTMVDPLVYEAVLATTDGADILGEVQRGTGITANALFGMVEWTGTVAPYGDFNENGRVGINSSFENRDNFRFQTIAEYGENEMEVYAEAKINYVSQMEVAAAEVLNRFMNYSYHFGISGLQNYGYLNDPGIAANTTVTPSTKAAGGVRWLSSSNASVATANEVFNDIQSLYAQAASQLKGNLKPTDPIVIVCDPISYIGFMSTNVYGKTAMELIQAVFKNLTIIQDPLYATASGNVIQLIVKKVRGQDTGYAAYSEKLNSGRVVPHHSGWSQKKTAATWGAIVRLPVAVAQMIGV